MPRASVVRHHYQKHRAPMQCLRPDQAHALLPVLGVSPARDDANDPDERRQSDPIGRYGCFRETRVRDTEECKNQDQQVKRQASGAGLSDCGSVIVQGPDRENDRAYRHNVARPRPSWRSKGDVIRR